MNCTAHAHLGSNHENNGLNEGNGDKSDEAGLRSPEGINHRNVTVGFIEPTTQKAKVFLRGKAG